MLSEKADGKMAKAGLMPRTAHDWESISLATPENKFADMGHHGARRCRNCGAVQKKLAQHSWMKVTGYRWEPKAGRCKPNA